MFKFRYLALVLAGACSLASAQDLVLTGHVQKVVLEPRGTENCPRLCPANAAVNSSGLQTVCISNDGGCQTLEVKVTQVYRGADQGDTRQFRKRIGEWGPTFPLTEALIVVTETAGHVDWSPAVERDGRIFVEPKRLGSFGVPRIPPREAERETIALDELLERNNTAR